MGTQCNNGTGAPGAAMSSGLFQSYGAACADDPGKDALGCRLAHLLRCSLMLSEPGRFARVEEGWEQSAHSCHRLRAPVDDMLRACIRFAVFV